jgi:Raf kinase inhibitor-like YbhB/YbcL family protein
MRSSGIPRVRPALVALAVLAGTASIGTTAQQVPAKSGSLALAIVSAKAQLQVTSPSFTAGGDIPERFSDYGQKFSPALRWKGAPAETRSFVLLMEDPDANKPKPFVHWALYNLPASVTELHEAIPAIPRLPELRGALQGRTSKGTVGYFGPRPPRTDDAHHYHFQVFALDSMLALDPLATREDVLAAMKGRVLASGEVVGTFRAPGAASK